MTENTQLDDKTTCDQCTKKYFPMTEDNTYGAIPLLGAVASCLVSGSTIMQMNFSPQQLLGTAIWYHVGFMVFALVQVFWGFQCASGAQAKKRKCLALWLACKFGEMLIPTGYVIAGVMIELYIPLFFILVLFLSMGCRKYIQMGKPQISIFATQALPYTITK